MNLSVRERQLTSYNDGMRGNKDEVSYLDHGMLVFY